MKTTINIFLLSLALGSSNKMYSELKEPSGEKSLLTFMILISTPEEVDQAKLTIKSIRDFGGKYSTSPIIVILSDPAEIIGEFQKGEVTDVIYLQRNESFIRFPFSDKVYACAQVEELVENSTEWLVWLNPDALVVAEPSELDAGENFWASLRPVHIQNIGSVSNKPLSDYWRGIYGYAGVDSNYVWEMTSYVDNQKIRAYFNSGCMAFRPEKGVLREWKRVFETMLLNDINYSNYSRDNNQAIFFHQAILSAIIISKVGRERINILSPSYGYPLVLQDYKDFINRKNSIDEMKIILCGSYNNLKSLTIEEPHKTWIKNYIN